MPLGVAAHLAYWEGSADLPAPIPSRPGYPGWQSSAVAGSLFGALQVWWEAAVIILRIAWRARHWSAAARVFLDRYGEEFAASTGEGRHLALATLRLTRHPDYPLARTAVRTTATTLGFNKPTAWVRLSRTLHERTDWAENAWRHLDAMRQLDATRTTTLTKAQQNFMVELAYQGYAINPRGKMPD